MATIASSNFTTMAYIAESAYGEIPGSGSMRYLPFTGESLQFTKESITSNNINPSRQVSDTIQTGFEVSGGLNIELGPKSFDDLIEAAMWDEWGTATNVEITATVATPANTITASAGTPFLNIAANQFVKISGMVNSENNGVFQVASRTDTVLTLLSSYTLVAESSTAGVDVIGNMISNPADGASSIRKSFFIEKSMEDLSPTQFLSYSGCMVNSMTVSAQASSILTGSFDFMGQTNTIYDTTSLNPTGGKLAYAGENILNSVSHVGDIRMDGVNVNVLSGASGVYFQSIDFTLTNNLRGVQAIGQMGNVTVSPGQLGVTGNMNAFFKDSTMYDKFTSGDEFSLSYEVMDTDGEGYAFYFPRVTVASSTMSAGGNDQDLVENMTWSALMDKTLNTSVQINRFYADYTDAPTNPTIYTG